MIRMRLVSCEEFLGRRVFKSYSEFILMMFIGKEYYRLGCMLDISMMRIDDILGVKQILLLNWLAYKGIIYLGSGIDLKEPDEREPYYFNMDAITANEGRLLEDVQESESEEACYKWSANWVGKQDYGSYNNDLYMATKLEEIILHIIAHMIVSIRECKIPRKPIKIVIDGLLANSTDNYVNIVSCQRTLPWFSKLVKLDIDLSQWKTDVDFSLFVNNGIMAGRRKYWGIGDKAKQMEQLGIVEGSICILYERKGMAETNPLGRITNASIVRVNTIGSDRVNVTTIPIYKTKEEIEADYIDIPDDLKGMFADMLNFNVNTSNRYISLYDLGIADYLYNESEFLAPIDEYGDVSKIITIDGKRKSVEMNQRNAIYWLLCQFSIEFDRDLYRNMYSGGESLLWDDYIEGV